MSTGRDQFDRLFNGTKPKVPRRKPGPKPRDADTDNPAGMSIGLYATRETNAGIDRIAEYYQRKLGSDKPNRSLAVKLAVEALLAAIDEKLPDFELPNVRIPKS